MRISLIDELLDIYLSFLSIWIFFLHQLLISNFGVLWSGNVFILQNLLNSFVTCLWSISVNESWVLENVLPDRHFLFIPLRSNALLLSLHLQWKRSLPTHVLVFFFLNVCFSCSYFKIAGSDLDSFTCSYNWLVISVYMFCHQAHRSLWLSHLLDDLFLYVTCLFTYLSYIFKIFLLVFA